MKLAPFFSYYGAKWRAAPHYPSPRYDRIIEPFAGSAGYSGLYFERDVVLVEKDPVIAALWRWLIASNARTILDLPLVDEGQTVADLDICDAGRSLIGFWLNKATAQPSKRPSKWMRSGHYPNQFWGEYIRARVAAQVEFISHWTILQADFSQIEDQSATWFIDPPYNKTGGHHYKYGSEKIDFGVLSEFCQSRTGQVVVCENQGETWLPFRPFLEIKSTKGKNRSGYSKEGIWSKMPREALDPAEVLMSAVIG